jgi:Transglycosylase
MKYHFLIPFLILSWVLSFGAEKLTVNFITSQSNKSIFFKDGKVGNIKLLLGGKWIIKNTIIKTARIHVNAKKTMCGPNFLNLFNKKPLFQVLSTYPIFEILKKTKKSPAKKGKSLNNYLIKKIVDKVSLKFENGKAFYRTSSNSFELRNIVGFTNNNGELSISAPILYYNGKYGEWIGKNIKANLIGNSFEKISFGYLKVYSPQKKSFGISGNVEKLIENVFKLQINIDHRNSSIVINGKGNPFNKTGMYEFTGKSNVETLCEIFQEFNSKKSLNLHSKISGNFEGKGKFKLNGNIKNIQIIVKSRNLYTKIKPISKNMVKWPNFEIKSNYFVKNSKKYIKTQIKAGDLKPVNLTFALNKYNGFEISGSLENMDCSKTFSTIPKTLIPNIKTMKLSGKFGLSFYFITPLDNFEKLSGSWKTMEGCKIVKQPDKIDLQLLNNPVKVVLMDDLKRKITKVLGPEDKTFIPFYGIPGHLLGAFLAAEDRNFFKHHGFDWPMIIKAAGFNLQNRKFKKGASSISQQLVKNLYLNSEKTISRKIEEFILTWDLEKHLSKKRILELYFNILEVGPNIRGIKEGSKLYFGRYPYNLTPVQSAHLALIIPSPRYFYKKFREPVISDEWTKKVRKLLRKVYKMGSIDKKTYEKEKEKYLVIIDY